MDEIHQAPYYGLPGYHRKIATAIKQYFLPLIEKDIAEYIAKCMKCTWHLFSICQSDLRQQIVNHAVEDEVYVQVKDKLQQQSIEKSYEGQKLEEDRLITYKNKVYIPNVAGLRRMVMDEIHQNPYSSHPGYQKTIATARKQLFLARNVEEHG